MTVRLAIVTDIHHGQDGFSKKASQALPLFEQFVSFANDAKPDFILDLGDRISDKDEATDLRLEREVADAFRALSAPVFHICGNHDVDFLSVAQNEQILGQRLDNQVLEIDGWTLLIWRADAKRYPNIGFALEEHDLIWLAAQINNATNPIAIFTHVPLSGHDVRANYWFARNPDAATYPYSERIRAVLEAARVPIVCFSGHVHWNTFNRVNGIAYATLQSLSETFTTYPEPAGAWTLLELDQNIACEVFGRDAFSWTLPAAQTMQRWLPKLPSFADNPEIRAKEFQT